MKRRFLHGALILASGLILANCGTSSHPSASAALSGADTAANVPNIFNLPVQAFAKISKEAVVDGTAGLKTAELGFLSQNEGKPTTFAILVTAPWTGTHAGNNGSIRLDLSTGDIEAASIYNFGEPSPLHGGNIFRYEQLLDSLTAIMRAVDAPAQSLAFVDALKRQLEASPGMHALHFGEGNQLWGWLWHQPNPVSVDYLAPKDSDMLILVRQDTEVLFSQRVAIKGGAKGHYATAVALPVEKAKSGNNHVDLEIAIVPTGGDWSQSGDNIAFTILIDQP